MRRETWTQSLAVLLSATLLFCSCSSKRNPGIIITTIGAVAVAAGIVGANYHCNTDADDPIPSEPACKEGNPEVGYSIAGVGLLVAAFGVYLIATHRDDDDEPIAKWPDGVTDIQGLNWNYKWTSGSELPSAEPE